MKGIARVLDHLGRRSDTMRVSTLSATYRSATFRAATDRNHHGFPALRHDMRDFGANGV